MIYAECARRTGKSIVRLCCNRGEIDISVDHNMQGPCYLTSFRLHWQRDVDGPDAEEASFPIATIDVIAFGPNRLRSSFGSRRVSLPVEDIPLQSMFLWPDVPVPCYSSYLAHHRKAASRLTPSTDPVFAPTTLERIG